VTQAATYRLFDIEVEEVSLVDRAANKRRYLIVKRSDMSQTTEEQSTQDETEETPESNEDSDDESDEGAGDEGGDDQQGDEEEGDANGESEDDDGEDDDESARGGADRDEPQVVMATAEALAKLTTILEALDKGARGAALAKAKGELRAVMDALAKAAGPRKGPKRKPPSRRAPDDDEDDDDDIDKSSMAEVRAAFQRVQELLARRGKSSRGAKPRKTNKRAPTSGSAPIAAKLDQVLAQLGSLTNANKEQAQRLSRLEKHAGMPNSAPVGEQPAGEDDNDVLWSLDLNKPTDREQVDKATSFY
jgi:hypothetical protein